MKIAHKVLYGLPKIGSAQKQLVQVQLLLAQNSY